MNQTTKSAAQPHNAMLSAAKKNKKDEFYTQLPDVENELRHYSEHFKGKTIICNCDDPWVSNFSVYFTLKFHQLGLKRLIMITYKEIFPLLKDNLIWLGYGFKGGVGHFFSKYEDTATAGNHKPGMIRVSGVVWFTNLEIPKRNEELILFKRYTPEEYPRFDNYHDKLYDTQKLEERIQELIIDDDVKNSGIYFYLLTGKEKYLHIRDFTPKMKLAAYERQKGICAKCDKHFEAQEMEADHITPWSKGGATIAENCQMLCRDCNRRKSDK